MSAAAGAGSGRRALVGPGIVLASAIASANALNAAFQFALARILDPEEYALLAALMAVVLVGAIPPLAFQATTARGVAAARSVGDPSRAASLLRGTLAGVLRWTAALLAVTVVATAIAAAAGAGNTVAVGATVATVAIALAIPVVWGGLQGSGRFGALSAAHLAFAGTRLAAGLAIGLAGGGVGAVMAGVAAATALTVVLTALPLRRMLAVAAGTHARRLATRPNAAAAAGLTALWALAYGDLLAAELGLPSSVAGDYAAASVGARVLMLIPIAVTTVLFPRVATLHDPVRERRYLLGGLGAVGLAAGAATAVLWAWAEPLVDLAFGTDYAEGAKWLGPLALAMSFYALVTVYLYHFLALGRGRFAAVLLALLGLQVVAYAAFHSRAEDLVAIQIGASTTALASAEAWYRFRLRRRRGTAP